jgi:hypothetical protein
MILETATETLPTKPKNREQITNPKLVQLSIEQKHIRSQLLNTPNINTETITALKHKRNQISHKIKTTVKQLKETDISTKLLDIENTPDHQKMFKVIKDMHRGHYEQPTIHDTNKQTIINSSELNSTIKVHFKKQFFSPKATPIPSFSDDQSPLTNPITNSKVTTCINCLNNS